MATLSILNDDHEPHSFEPISEASSDPATLPSLSVKQQAAVIKQCSDDIHALLDLEEIFPHLYQNNLLTDSEQDSLHSTNNHWSRKEKISVLVTSLPRKGSNVLRRFHDCLVHSSYGTAHMELAEILCSKANTVRESASTSGYEDNQSGFLTSKKLLWVAVTAAIIFIATVTIIIMTVWFYYPQLKHQVDLLHSKTLPYRSEEIIGREQEIHELLELTDFGSSTSIRIVNIIGSPGFGKSTLAIHLGHKMVDKGVLVHYVNMAEISDRQLQQALAEKLLDSADILSKDISFNRLLKWISRTHTSNLLIFDNCDDSLHLVYQKEALQEAVEKIVESSNKIKVVMTSREITMHLHDFQQYKLYELSTKAACALLKQKVSHKVNISIPEIETLAELAGNVPLALQIIGSLLLLPDPPTPGVIIEELKEQPILTLSPEQLPKSQQINASLSLSYKYLSREHRMIGQFLAHFPGSFKSQAARVVFSGQNGTNTKLELKNIHRTMHILVQRSLLVYDKRSDRYGFHKLIREYFLDVQRTDKLFRNNTFAFAFNHFYTDELLRLATLFVRNEHIKALKTLDVEKHNFQQMFENIKFLTEHGETVSTFDDLESLSKQSGIDLTVIQVVVQATNAGLLKCRFTDAEIAELLKNSIQFVRIKYLMRRNLKQLPNGPEFQYYYSLIAQLANIEERLHGTASAIKVYLEHEYDLCNNKLFMKTTLCISFYSKLAEYHFALGQYQEGLDIAMSYFNLGNILMALQFLSPSLVHEELNALDKVGTALIVAELNRKRNVCMKYENLRTGSDNVIDFRTILASVKQIPPIELYQNCSKTLQIISLLWSFGHNEYAVQLEEKLLQVIKEIGISPLKLDMSWETVYEVALHLYNLNRYSKVVELGVFLLQSMEQERYCICHSLKPKLQTVVARSLFHAGNYSSALDMLESVFDEVDQQLHKEEFKITCRYLLLRPSVWKINKCYSISQNFVNNVVTFGFYIWSLTIVILPFGSQPESVTVPLSTSVYPESLSSQTNLQVTTKSKDVVFAIEYFDVLLWKYVSNIWVKGKNLLLKFINAVWLLIKSSSIRILIGIFSVWIRLIVLVYVLRLLLRRITVVIGLVCFLAIAFSVIPSDESMKSFAFFFYITLVLIALSVNYKFISGFVLYWSFVCFFLVVAALFREKGGIKNFYRAIRDPRLFATLELYTIFQLGIY